VSDNNKIPPRGRGRGEMSTTIKIKTYIVEYEKDDGRVWETEVEAYSRAQAIEDFEDEWKWHVRDCYLKEEK
jgi:hypothetical protein